CLCLASAREERATGSASGALRPPNPQRILEPGERSRPWRIAPARSARLAQAGEEEAIHSALVSPVVGADGEGPCGGPPAGVDSGEIGAVYREGGTAGKGGGELALAFLGEERAGREHQPPAGFEPGQGTVEQGRLQHGEGVKFRAVLD